MKKKVLGENGITERWSIFDQIIVMKTITCSSCTAFETLS